MTEAIRYSQIAAWNSCPHKWHLQYQRKLRPRVERPCIDMGGAVHKGLEAQLKGKSLDEAMEVWYLDKLQVGLNPDEELSLESIRAEAVTVATRAYLNLDIGHKWETYEGMVEHGFDVELGHHTLHGTLDWVAREVETGQVWLVDHKVRKTFQPASAEEVNLQMVVYQYLLHTRGVPAVGSIQHQIRDHVPRTPRPNKDGETMSRAAISTDWETYEATLRAYGFEVTDYLDMRAKLSNNRFYEMTRAYRSNNEVINVFNSCVLPALTEMSSTHEYGAPRKLSQMNCAGCSMRELCLADLRGDDTEYLERTHYMKEGEAHESYELVEDDA